MNTNIEEYAKRLKLSWIREHYHEIEAASNEEYILKLFEHEIQQREERKMNLLLKQATLPKIGTNPYDWKDIVLTPGLKREDLLDGLFIEQQENLIFYGGVGTGKTYLATLIGLNAIQKYGKSIKFYTVASLVNRLLEANEKGNLNRLFKQIEKLDLLILDELGYIPLHKQGAELLFQVISMCYEAKSILITTNLQFGQWNHVFGDPILTEAVIDRLIHHSHLIVFKGDSHRYKESIIQR
ncbi:MULTISPECIES: IS21-like element helper ATPase IstB [Cytobacillus]|uniref:Transposase n=1 Tax=Cytobacillus firmus DS1 TaxID=1307436 RepID=W7KLQ7_CYTFI|nr:MULTISPECIES: IS21-like element helper ATPase IstB [Cytobacillus]HDJ1468232.1 IS21-like element helper ATPase IstB [Clostridioides difficile]EWG08330.1 transposase [Cytobacillus firmus DS1]MBG9546189.1 ATP-binding protein [Cytobacillus firmus]MBG9546901.1 ATP-binding protein [Cytobacillus firmus]MBG9549558.1 ATP-binding protein [Cytobacillus firmus]